MRTMLGVDAEEHYREALALLARMRFRDNEILLTHVQEPILSPLAVAPELMAYGDVRLERKLRDAGERLLRDAEQEARERGTGRGLMSRYQVGAKAGALMDLATEEECDLVAIGSGRKGTLESLFKGSVGRALAIDCVQSFLVARGGTEAKGPVRAIYATDLSILSDRCLDRFLGMMPQGVEEVTVLFAEEDSATDDLTRQFGYEKAYDVTNDDLRRIANEVGEDMAERLRGTGYKASFVWAAGYPREALRRAMEQTGADLLVLGAKGHRFIERLLLGSVAYHEVAAEPYSVMVLRPPQENEYETFPI